MRITSLFGGTRVPVLTVLLVINPINELLHPPPIDGPPGPELVPELGVAATIGAPTAKSEK